MRWGSTVSTALLLFRASALLLCVSWLNGAQPTTVHDLENHPVNPMTGKKPAINVLLFVRSDCPLTKRYAPELARIAREFEHQPVRFWLVFADRSETPSSVREFVAAFKLPGSPLLDPKQELVQQADAIVAPEAAVFDSTGKRVYSGRIDDLYVDFGKARPAAQEHDLEDALTATLKGTPVVHAQTRAVGCALADLR